MNLDYRRYDWIDIWKAILIFVLLAVGGILTYKMMTHVTTERVEVVSVNNDMRLTSAGGLFYCWVDTDEYVCFWINDNSELTRRKYEISKVKIYEDAKEGEAYALIDSISIGVVQIELHVPVGTIQQISNLIRSVYCRIYKNIIGGKYVERI